MININNKRYHTFAYQSNYYLLDCWNYEIKIIDDKQYVKYVELEQLAAINDERNIDEFVNRKFEQGNFSFAPYHGCNLRCKYCFAASGDNFTGSRKDMSESMLKEIMDFVYFDILKNCKSYRLDFVSGGEPLLNFDIIKHAIKYGEELFQRTGKKLTIFLVTNGTINIQKYWDFLNESNVYLGVSIDGTQKNHDEFRKDMNQNGTYHTVLNTIDSVIHSSKYSSKFRAIWGLCVITGKTQSLIDMLLSVKETGIKQMQMKFARLPKDHDLALNADALDQIKTVYSEFTEFLAHNIENHDLSNLNMILNETDYFGKYIFRLLIKSINPYRCGAGKNKFSFDVQGNIYPCDSFVGNNDYLIGNVKIGVQRDVIERFKAATIDNRPLCKSCWAKYLCGGDCYHNSYLSNQNIEHPDEIFCELTKYFIEMAAYLINKLKETNQLTSLQKVLSVKSKLSE